VKDIRPKELLSAEILQAAVLRSLFY